MGEPLANPDWPRKWPLKQCVHVCDLVHPVVHFGEFSLGWNLKKTKIIFIGLFCMPLRKLLILLFCVINKCFVKFARERVGAEMRPECCKILIFKFRFSILALNPFNKYLPIIPTSYEILVAYRRWDIVYDHPSTRISCGTVLRRVIISTNKTNKFYGFTED